MSRIDKGFDEHAMNLCLYGIFVYLRNPINVGQIELLIICLYTEGSEDRFCGCPTLLMQKNLSDCMYGFQEVNEVQVPQSECVVSLANNLLYALSAGSKILMEPGKLTDNIRVAKIDSDLVLTECLCRLVIHDFSLFQTQRCLV